MIIKYQPYKLQYNQPHTLGSRTFKTKEEAIEYALDRGLKDNEILIKELYFEEEYVKEF